MEKLLLLMEDLQSVNDQNHRIKRSLDVVKSISSLNLPQQFSQVDKLEDIIKELNRNQILILNETGNTSFSSSEQDLLSNAQHLEALRELLQDYSARLCGKGNRNSFIIQKSLHPQMVFSVNKKIGFIRNIVILFALSFYANVFCVPGEVLDDRFNSNFGGGPLWRYVYNLSIKAPFLLTKDAKGPPFYDLYGDATFGKNNIVLTPQFPNKLGSVWSKNKNDLDEWMAVFSLKIAKNNISQSGSDGFAFWYTADKGDAGPVFGNKDTWVGMGIFLDSFDNDGKNNNPIVQAVYNSGGYSYKMENDGEGQHFAHGFYDFRSSNFASIGKPQNIFVKIIYHNRTLEVFIDKDSYGYNYEKVITYSPIYLTPGYYFGLSASTGSMFPDSHQLVSMDIYSIREPILEPKQPHLSHTDKDRISIHDRLMDNITQKIMRQQNQYLHSNVSDDTFKADIYNSIDKIKEVLFEILEKTKDIQVSIPEAIPPDLMNSAQKQSVITPDSFNSHFSGLSKDLSYSVKILQKDMDSLATSITSLEKKNNAMIDNMQAVIKILQDLLGTQSGSKSKLDHLQLLTNLAHEKLSLLEDASKKTYDGSKGLQDILYTHSTWVTYLFLYAAIFQLILVGSYILYKKATKGQNHNSPYDRKFI